MNKAIRTLLAIHEYPEQGHIQGKVKGFDPPQNAYLTRKNVLVSFKILLFLPSFALLAVLLLLRKTWDSLFLLMFQKKNENRPVFGFTKKC